MTILITGAGGFIGGHIVAALAHRGAKIKAVDIKPVSEWYQQFDRSNVSNQCLDLAYPDACRQVVGGVDTVYNMAADMGGIGFIEKHKAECMMSVLINTNLLEAARREGVSKFLFSSSACVYPTFRQSSKLVVQGLTEDSAYPAQPEDGYGWEKLFSERMCRHFSEDYGLSVRVPRLHNVYGPFGSWHGGREKAPSAICRKVAEVALGKSDSIEIWGDGHQQRSFTWIDDTLEGIDLLMQSDFQEPINIGSSELISVNALVSMVQGIAGVEAPWIHKLQAPQGVQGRNSDNTLVRKVLDWEPSVTLQTGMERLYAWVYDQVAAQ